MLVVVVDKAREAWKGAQDEVLLDQEDEMETLDKQEAALLKYAVRCFMLSTGMHDEFVASTDHNTDQATTR